MNSQEPLDDAVRLYRQAVARDPNNASAHRGFGTALKAQGDLARAADCFRRAIALRPAYPEAWNNLGNTLAEQGDDAQAAECFRRAALVRPGFAGAHFNRAQALGRLGRFDGAIDACRRAIAIEPRNIDFYNGLGTVLFDAQRIDECLEAYEIALDFSPDFASARYNRSLAWLLCGDYAGGWPEYEWRWRRPEASSPPFLQPRWTARLSRHGTILLNAEQGLGDTIQFARYASLVKQRAARVILRCQKPLIRLLESTPGVDALISQAEPTPEFDVWFPLLSLPVVFTPTLAEIPAAAYLSADESLVRFWRSRLASIDGFRVGIHWQGNPAFLKDRFRSIPLTEFEPLANVAGARLVSLQNVPGNEQLRDPKLAFPVVDLGLTLEGMHGPFVDTAAILKCLDLVITSDSSLAHLAGALGVETWLAVPSVPEWRWLRYRDDSPWYPTFRLFRQSRVGEWEDVFSRMAFALDERVASSRRTRGI